MNPSFNTFAANLFANMPTSTFCWVKVHSARRVAIKAGFSVGASCKFSTWELDSMTTHSFATGISFLLTRLHVFGYVTRTGPFVCTSSSCCDDDLAGWTLLSIMISTEQLTRMLTAAPSLTSIRTFSSRILVECMARDFITVATVLGVKYSHGRFARWARHPTNILTMVSNPTSSFTFFLARLLQHFLHSLPTSNCSKVITFWTGDHMTHMVCFPFLPTLSSVAMFFAWQ